MKGQGRPIGAWLSSAAQRPGDGRVAQLVQPEDRRKNRGTQLGPGKGEQPHARAPGKLIRFLSAPDAPLDNNICERALKHAILHRKNALF